MDAVTILPPDEAAVRAHLSSMRFRRGVAQEKWRLVGLRFPDLYVAVAAAPRQQSPDWLLLRMEVSGFPAQGPTGRLYHGAEDRPLTEQEWPKGEGGQAHPCFSAFGPCLYHPIDRLAFAGGHWAGLYEEQRWSPHYHLTRYLEVLHGVLTSPEYSGARLLSGADALPPSLVEQVAA